MGQNPLGKSFAKFGHRGGSIKNSRSSAQTKKFTSASEHKNGEADQKSLRESDSGRSRQASLHPRQVICKASEEFPVNSNQILRRRQTRDDGQIDLHECNVRNTNRKEKKTTDKHPTSSPSLNPESI